MRLFIAILLEEAIQQALLQMIQNIRQYARQGVFPGKEHLHLTLHFLGETPEGSLPDLQRCMAQAVTRTVSFPLECGGFGQFPRGNASILWAGVTLSPPLLALHQSLSQALSERGFVLDARPYKPHLTLGRQVTFAQPFAQIAEKIAPFKAVQTVSAVHLMRSERIQGQLRYTSLHKSPLQAPNSAFDQNSL